MEMLWIFYSWLFPTILILSISCLFIYTLCPTNSPYGITNPKFPPSPQRLPIIGNLHQLQGKNRHQTLWKLSQKHGPVMLLHFGSKPFLVISSSTMAKEVLKTHDHLLCTRPNFQGTKQLTYNYLDIAFSPHDNHWREMRKVLVSEFLGPKRAKLFNHVTMMEISDMIQSLSLHPSNVAVNLDNKFLALTNAIICKVAFGKSYREEPFKGVTLKEMIDEAMVMLGDSFGDIFPVFGRILDKIGGRNHRMEVCFRNIDGYIQRILNEHTDNTAEETNDFEKDFVHALLELRSNKSTCDGSQLTTDDMKALILDVFLGGIDSTVVTMVWAMSEIVRNSRVMQKLQTEIRRKPYDCTHLLLCLSHTNALAIVRLVGTMYSPEQEFLSMHGQ
ncbi:cytochrome P450 71B34-like protein [Tanacetum coccineum]